MHVWSSRAVVPAAWSGAKTLKLAKVGHDRSDQHPPLCRPEPRICFVALPANVATSVDVSFRRRNCEPGSDTESTNYIFRVVHPQATRAFAARHDVSVRRCMEILLDVSITNHTWDVGSLLLHMGGLGIRSEKVFGLVGLMG